MNKRVVMQPDKMQHFIAMFTLTFFLGMAYDIIVVVVLALALSIGKEIFDKFKRKQDFEKGDFIADIIGIIAGVALFYLAGAAGYY